MRRYRKRHPSKFPGYDIRFSNGGSTLKPVSKMAAASSGALTGHRYDRAAVTASVLILSHSLWEIR